MSYTPTEWATGDTITAAKLNKMENGIADGFGSGAGLFIIHASGVASSTNPQTQPTFDKTYAEVLSAFNSGLIPIVVFSGNNTTAFANITGYSVQGAFMFSFSIQGRATSNWSVVQTDIVLGDNGLSMSSWTEVFFGCGYLTN